jgi:hypothetical protein
VWGIEKAPHENPAYEQERRAARLQSQVATFPSGVPDRIFETMKGSKMFFILLVFVITRENRDLRREVK